MYRSVMQTKLKSAFGKVMKISCINVSRAFNDHFLEELEKLGFTLCTKEERDELDAVANIKKQNEKIQKFCEENGMIPPPRTYDEDQ